MYLMLQQNAEICFGQKSVYQQIVVNIYKKKGMLSKLEV
jgi:hypothetical protein